MAKKALLKDSKGFEILPITRGELVLDSSGNMALHSHEFLASQDSPGLISSEDKKKIDDMIASSVEEPFAISINEGITSGKDYYTYNGSYSTKINIKEGDNIKFNTSNNQIEIYSINTTYALSGKFEGGFVNTLSDCFGNESTSVIPIMSPATEISDGGYGLVPYPKATQQNKYLRGDGTWETPQDTIYSVVSKTLDGLSPKIGTTSSAIIANSEDEWVLTSTKGGTPSWRNLPLNAFKNDNDNTTYELEGLRDGKKYIISLVSNDGITSAINIPRMVGASELSDGKAGLVPLPLKSESLLYFRGDGTWDTPKDTKNTTGAVNTTSKIFLVGSKTQTTNNDYARTYSNSKCYTSGGYLYSNSTKVSVEGHEHSAEDITSGTLAVARGGTGQTTLKNAAKAIINALSTNSSSPVDADYYICQYAGGGTTTATYHRRPHSALYNYIKGKLNDDYLPISGGSMTSGARISASGGDLYIGNASNAGWVHLQDICSQEGRGNWSIKTSGVAVFQEVSAPDGFFQDSDERLKEFFEPVAVDLDKLKKLHKNYFRFKDSSKMNIGVSAQEIQALYPEIVSETEFGYLKIDYSKLSVIALRGIDKLYEMYLELKEENRNLTQLLQEKIK